MIHHKEYRKGQPLPEDRIGGSGNYFQRNFFSVPRRCRGKFLCPQGREENNFRVHRCGKNRLASFVSEWPEGDVCGKAVARILNHQAARAPRHGFPGGKLPLSGAAGSERSGAVSIDEIAGPHGPAAGYGRVRCCPPVGENRRPGRKFRPGRDVDL